MLPNAYLINGTGNACAWHKSAKFSEIPLTKDQTLVSLENVGALAPTGSTD